MTMGSSRTKGRGCVMSKIDMRWFMERMMGKRVTFSSFYKRGWIPDPTVHDGVRFMKTWVAKEIGPKDRNHGWVVGIRWLRTGVTVRDYDGGRFGDRGPRVVAYLVAPWPTMKPIMVPPSAVHQDPGVDKAPVRYVNDRWRDILSEDSKTWPRDSKGRWVKGT
jgi:hypothetical protein